MSTTTMHRAAVDAEFRAFLENRALAVPATDTLPAPVEDLDTSALEAWTADVAVGEISACVTSCSWGPFTFVCDGSTKSGL